MHHISRAFLFQLLRVINELAATQKGSDQSVFEGRHAPIYSKDLSLPQGCSTPLVNPKSTSDSGSPRDLAAGAGVAVAVAAAAATLAEAAPAAVAVSVAAPAALAEAAAAAAAAVATAVAAAAAAAAVRAAAAKASLA